MIKNEKQYNITRKKLLEINNLIMDYIAKKSLSVQNEMYVAALQMQQHTFKKEIRDYEKLQASGMPLKRNITIAQIPNILIEHKIAKHLSQKEYAAILGIKEQQLQRYEAENYASVSLKNLIYLIEKADIKVSLSLTSK
jgi:HTH-type transcriptional regulator / antitoxin HipB